MSVMSPISKPQNGCTKRESTQSHITIMCEQLEKAQNSFERRQSRTEQLFKAFEQRFDSQQKQIVLQQKHFEQRFDSQQKQIVLQQKHIDNSEKSVIAAKEKFTQLLSIIAAKNIANNELSQKLNQITKESHNKSALINRQNREITKLKTILNVYGKEHFTRMMC